MSRTYTPAVRAAAHRAGLSLTRLTGTGTAGRVTLADVASAVSTTADHGDALGTVEALDPVHHAHARNPLLDMARQVPAHHELARQAAQVEPAPTLFSTGDLPPFTASGIDPQQLLRLPWQARHRAAAETDRAKVLAIFDAAGGDPDTSPDHVLYASMTFGQDAGPLEYQRRFTAWLSGNTPTQVAAHEARVLDEARARTTQHLAETRRTEASGADGLYGHLFPGGA